MSYRRSIRQRGFTLIELLVVVAIIGAITAIALPSLLHTLQSARQKRTLADIRTIAVSVTVYNNDNGNFPILGDTTATALESFIGTIPEIDGWGEAYRYSCATGVAYTLVSYGSNFVPDEPYVYGPIQRHWDDIVVVDSQWVQWPEGLQTN